MRILLLTLVLTLCGCSAKSYLDDIPNVEFRRFEYHRAGNLTSAHIIAEGATMEDCILMVENVNITGDYGPAFNVNIKMEGYIRSPRTKDCYEEPILP